MDPKPAEKQSVMPASDAQENHDSDYEPDYEPDPFHPETYCPMCMGDPGARSYCECGEYGDQWWESSENLVSNEKSFFQVI